MSFQLNGHYVWDFWLVHGGGDYHLFCLTAPRTHEHPDLRHPHARIAHATSGDLQNWTFHGVVLAASDDAGWDDGVTWTGSVVKRPDGKWMMFYTGCSKAEDCKVQRIGAAVSDDLYSWEKISGPLLELDPRYYEKLDASRWHDQAFRDPWVYKDPEGPGWRMLFTAREPNGPKRGAGVIGQAYSPDLIHWTAGAPLFSIGYYGEMEVPQLFQLDGWWYCLFSNSCRHRDPDYMASGKCGMATGTHYIRSRSPNGPFELVEEEFFAGDSIGHFYGGRVVETPDGGLAFMAFLNHAEDGSFVGQITSPMAIWTTPEGYLRIDGRRYGFIHQGERAQEHAEIAAGLHDLAAATPVAAAIPAEAYLLLAAEVQPTIVSGIPAGINP